MADNADLVVWIGRAAAGDRDAFGKIYDAVAPRMFGLAIKILGDHGEAEEATMDAMVQVWRQSPQYDPERSEALAWLLMITRSRSLDKLRSRKRADAVTDESEDRLGEIPADQPDPEEHHDRDRQAARVRDAVGRLTPEQRSAVEAVYFQGMTHSQVADHYRLPLGTVKTRVRAGIQALREELGSAGEMTL